MEWQEFSAKTVSDAVLEAAIKLGTTRDKVEYEVIFQGSSGFFGIGSKNAVIKARLKEEEQDILEEIRMDLKLDKPIEKKQEKKSEKKPEKKQEKKPEKKVEKQEVKKQLQHCLVQQCCLFACLLLATKTKTRMKTILQDFTVMQLNTISSPMKRVTVF